MDGGKKSNREQESAREYLQRIERLYSIQLVGGIDKEKGADAEHHIHDHTAVRIENRPVDVRVRADWPIRFISIVALLLSTGTLVLLIFTVAYARLQWVEAHRSADASIASADAAKSAADTANATLKEMEQTRKSSFAESERSIQLDQRAWLKVEIAPSSQQNEFRSGTIPRALFKVSNTGKTPAEILTVFGLMSDEPIEYDLAAPIDACISMFTPASILINPGSDYDFAQTTLMGSPLGANFDHDIQYRKTRLISVGCISYKDIFDEMHWFRWCLSWNPISHWEPCEEGNGTGDGAKPEFVQFEWQKRQKQQKK